jgi:hypothetical protein
MTAALLALATGGAHAERCIGGGFRFTEGNTFVTGATRKDEPCTLGSAGYSGIRFLTAYKPDAGYAGPDEFAVKMRYLLRSTQVELTTVVHVQMTIGP